MTSGAQPPPRRSREVSLPVGTRMPFMSSRKDGKPVALMDVLWDGR